MRDSFCVRLLIVSLASAWLGGCAFSGLRHEPTTPPIYTVENGRVSSVYRDLPVSLDVTRCTDSASVCDSGIFGGTSPSGLTPVRNVIRNEFEKLIKQAFRVPVGGEREKLTISVATRSVVVLQRGSTYTCELSLEVALIDPIAQDRRPYLKDVFKSTMTSRERKDEFIPRCEYAAIHDIMDQLLAAIEKDRNVIRRLDELVTSPEDIKIPPRLERISCNKRPDGRVGGSCDVFCNDWEAFDADRWARAKIRETCSGRLGVSPERLRVVFNGTYDEQKHKWKYTFAAKARVGLAMNYDPATKSGVCTADLGILEMSATEAAEVMKKYVLDEMKLRKGAVWTDGELAEALVRFDELRTDEAANQLSMAFRLIK